MPEKLKLSPEQEAKKEVWLRDLAGFIVDANTHTWAAEGAEVEPQRPGYKELRWPLPSAQTGKIEGDWELRDSFTGYFRAPGMTTVYYKGMPAWTMVYGGTGMRPGKYEITKPTFTFLKATLLKVTTELPYRGPRTFRDGEWVYEMGVDGDLEDFKGEERIFRGATIAFTQFFAGGIVIGKDSDRSPVYPWDR